MEALINRLVFTVIDAVKLTERDLMRFICTVAAMFFMHSVAATSWAGMIVENGPASSTSFQLGGVNDDIETVVWTQHAANNVSISALISSPVVGRLHTVQVYLEENKPGNVILTSTVNFSGANPLVVVPMTLLSGLSLSQDWYRLTIFTTDKTDVVQWSNGTGTTNTADGTFLYSEFATTPVSNVAQPYLSLFTQSVNPLGFRVTGIVVPEPSSFVMCLSSLVLICVGSRFRERSA